MEIKDAFFTNYGLQLGEEIPVVTEPERPSYRSRKLVFGLRTKMFHR